MNVYVINQDMPCPACGKNFINSNPDTWEHHGLCWECYRSLNKWLMDRCKEFGYTKIRTGLVLIIALLIGKWLNERRNGSGKT